MAIRPTRPRLLPRTAAALLLAAAGSLAAPSQGVASESAPALAAEMPSVLGLEPDPEREPRPAPLPPTQVAARTIWIAHAESRSAPAGVTRSREQARTRAAAIAIVARSRGADFAELARRWTDDPERRESGGFLGTIRPRKDASALERSLFRTSVGGVLGPLETPEGFIVAQRVPIEFLAYDAIFVGYSDPGATTPFVRSQEDALGRATALLLDLAPDPSRFDARKAEVMQGAEAEMRGGTYGPVPVGDLAPEIEGAVLALPIGGVGGPVATRGGFLVVRRIEVTHCSGDKLLVRYRGSLQAPLTVVRSREEARERAEALLAAVRTPGADFGAIAAKESDDPADRTRMGRWSFAACEGGNPVALAISRLEIGESTVVESEFGFHVVRRVALERE